MDDTYRSPVGHSELKKWVQKFLDLSRENATLARRDRDYYDGEQISAAVKKELEQRGQAPIYTNKISSGIGGLLGIYDASVSDPEAMPRNSQSQGAADVATKTLRYLADKADFKRTRTQSSKDYFVEGVGAAIVQWTGKYASITPIRWEDFIYDPFSRDHDFADAKWLGVAKLVDAADVQRMFPDTFTSKTASSDFSDFFDDSSKKRLWWGNSNQVRLVEIYYERDGEWNHAFFTDSALLYSAPSEYEDDEGYSIHPIRATSYEVKRNGDRYGAIRHMVPLQDEVNARRSRLLHLTNHRQVQITDQFALSTDQSIARREASKADGVMPFGYQPVSAPDLAQGQMLILQKADSDLDRMCPTPAVLGRLGSNNESGRARQVLQQAGYTELARAFSRLEAFEHSIYRLLWSIARQYMDQPTWIRVTADPRTAEFLQINEPVMGRTMKPAVDPMTGEPVIDPYTGQPQMIPTIGVVGYKNRLAELDLDIVLTTVPDTVTLDQEVFSKLMETAQSTGIGPFDPAFIAYLEMSNLSNKRETIERIQRLAAEAASKDDGTAAMLQQGAAEADIEAKKARALKDGATAQKTATEAAMLTAQASVASLPQTYGTPFGQ